MRYLTTLFALALVGLCATANTQYQVVTTSAVPMSKPLAGHFAGELNNQLWTWGGYTPEMRAGSRPMNRNYDGYGLGATADVPQGTLCIGGMPASGQSLAEVFLTRRRVERQNKFSQWRYDRGLQQGFPSLPKRLHNLVAAYSDGYVYATGGQTDSVANHTVYRLAWPDGQAWDSVAVMPGPARLGAVAVVQGTTRGPALYIMGGEGGAEVRTTGVCLNLNTLEWTTLEWPQVPTAQLPGAHACARPVGCASVLVMGGTADEGLASDVLVYNTYTDVWSRIPGTPQLARRDAALARVDGFWFMTGGEDDKGECTSAVQCVEVLDQSQRTVWDHLVLALVAILFVAVVRKPAAASTCLPRCAQVGGRVVRSLGGVVLWLLPFVPFVMDWSVGLLYVILVVLYVLADNPPKLLSARMARVLTALFALLRLALWLLVPSYVLSVAVGLPWWTCVAASALVPAAMMAVGGARHLARAEALQWALALCGAAACIVVAASGAGEWAMMAAVLAGAGALVALPCLENKLRLPSRLVLFGQAMGVGVLFVSVGSLWKAYYQTGQYVFPIYLPEIWQWLPSVAVHALPSGLTGLVLAMLAGQSWCEVAKLSLRIADCVRGPEKSASRQTDGHAA